ncbi:hypothetical protein FK178_10975 [Antarcticibacterium arcticum]|uniref:Uncharacterized protein n=1 Tax=Antarcticibacterium arcticum TaxID=2585771 RepID=A0A5B8YPI0_9FLAO|nr:hypothetical protein [Antarcticibacterium arcticum]QED38206.1 hypothetical protein FK178_10975 [Antarcticibacterium arcticum]
MQAALSNSSMSSYLYKMDNVLYEVKDLKGILKNNNYDAWKQEVIEDLAGSGYIRLNGDKYVITREGREVIRHDSFLYYNRRTNLEKIEEKEIPAAEQKLNIFKKHYIIPILAFLVLVLVTLFRLR